MTAVFLSLDIDYWTETWLLEKELGGMLQYLKKRGAPIQVVMNHQQMLPEVNNSGAKILVNVDHHSDLGSWPLHSRYAPIQLNCGSWVSYVRWRKEGSYLWLRDSLVSYGNCGITKKWNSNTDWAATKTIQRTQALPLFEKVRRSVVGVGIALSPAYSTHYVYKKAREMLKGLPYRKGERSESRVRDCRPPV